MAAIAIVTTVLVFLLVIGLFFLLVSTIFLVLAVLKKKRKLFIALPIIGIILSLIPLIISIIGISWFRSKMNENDEPQINTGTKLYWKHDKNSDEDEYFFYKEKKYILLTGIIWDRPKSREQDKPVANIIDYEENIASRIFMFIFGIKDRENILYTIKNYPDDSLLMEDRFGAVYCEEDKYSEKNNYFDNIDNYKYYASYGYVIEETNSVELFDREIIKELYTYSGSGDLFQRPSEGECNYVRIFGISNDGILIKNIASIIIYNNQLYKEFGFFTEEEPKGMAILDKRQSEYINKIILNNRW